MTNPYTGAKTLPLDPKWSFRCMTDEECEAAYHRLMNEGTMAYYFPQTGINTTLEQWMTVTCDTETFPMAFLYNGELVGFAQNFPESFMTQCMQVNPVMFREFFSLGLRAFWHASMWALQNLDCISLLGKTPKSNRHIARMLPRIGYKVLGEVPGLFWFNKLQRYDTGIISVATTASLSEALNKEGALQNESV